MAGRVACCCVGLRFPSAYLRACLPAWQKLMLVFKPHLLAFSPFSPAGPATRMDNGVGPLRIWPGGLCLSRAVGDFDVGDSVIPFPHIMQVCMLCCFDAATVFVMVWCCCRWLVMLLLLCAVCVVEYVAWNHAAALLKHCPAHALVKCKNNF